MWGAIVGAGISTVSAISSSNAANRAAREQRNYINQMQQLYGNIDIPEIADQEVQFIGPELVGEMSPEELRSLELQRSSMEGVTADPEAVAKQQEALSQLSEIAEGGVTEADKATMREIRRDVGQSAKARRDAILANMAQRGVLGSGMELAAQLQGEQQAVQAESEAGDRAVQQAQARALQGLTRKGSLSSQMRGQSFGEQSDIAKAQDVIKRFNVQNQQNVMAQNIAARNQAQLQNLQARQSIENEQNRLRNLQEQQNKALIQQQYENEMAKAAGMSGAYSAGAKAAGQAAAGHAGAAAGAIGSGAGFLGQMFKGGGGTGQINKVGGPDLGTQYGQYFGLEGEGDDEINKALQQYGGSGSYSPFGGNR